MINPTASAAMGIPEGLFQDTPSESKISRASPIGVVSSPSPIDMFGQSNQTMQSIQPMWMQQQQPTQLQTSTTATTFQTPIPQFMQSLPQSLPSPNQYLTQTQQTQPLPVQQQQQQFSFTGSGQTIGQNYSTGLQQTNQVSSFATLQSQRNPILPTTQTTFSPTTQHMWNPNPAPPKEDDLSSTSFFQ